MMYEAVLVACGIAAGSFGGALAVVLCVAVRDGDRAAQIELNEQRLEELNRYADRLERATCPRCGILVNADAFPPSPAA